MPSVTVQSDLVGYLKHVDFDVVRTLILSLPFVKEGPTTRELVYHDLDGDLVNVDLWFIDQKQGFVEYDTPKRVNVVQCQTCEANKTHEDRRVRKAESLATAIANELNILQPNSYWFALHRQPDDQDWG